MHLCNAWLPPPVAEAAKREGDVFTEVVQAVMQSYQPDDPESVYSTLKWVPIIDLFLKTKSDLKVEDVSTIVEFGLKVFLTAENKLYAQVRWGNILVRLVNKNRKRLSLEVQWRPLYDVLIHTHFTRSTGPEGFRLRQQHFNMLTALVQSCRRFFPQNSAIEIWSEFRSLMENPWHNASFEGAGLLRVFLPMNNANKDYFQSDWIKICLSHWTSIPNCQFWNIQWASITARVIKSCKFLDWESALPDLFNIYLNMFEVPVANGSASYPFPRDVPRSMKILFANGAATPYKFIAKSIVYLIKPGGSAQKHFTKLVNLLEQYYHPSNGGRWTHSLQQFLYHMVNEFQKRLQLERLKASLVEPAEEFMAKHERASFVTSILKLIHRGQYSKDDQLSKTVADATSILSYIEPSLVLPFLSDRYHMALETMTATHQLKSALTSVAYSGRSLFFATLPPGSSNLDGAVAYADVLKISLSNALLGMDANDPPKTLATMQLIGSLFSSISSLDDNSNEGSLISSFPLSEWLDEFFDRLFSLLQNLEHGGVTNESLYSSAASGTFLVEDGPYYFCMLAILTGRLSDSLYDQALKKISKFVTRNILPGAIAEVGFLCGACVQSNPQEAVVQLIQPILESVITSLKTTPATGFGSRSSFNASFSKKDKSSLSPALETSIVYKLKVVAVGISYGGPSLLLYKEQLKEVIFLAFDSTSWKVNTAGDHVLRSLLGSLIQYYPVDQYRCVMRHPFVSSLEEWIDKKDFSLDKQVLAPQWHIPIEEEVDFANELLKLHFEFALLDLQTICQSKIHMDSGDEKDHLKVTLLRVDSSLQGVMSCLPDFKLSSEDGIAEDNSGFPFLIAGAMGSCVGSSELREKASDVIHETCKYLLKEKSDDSILFLLIVRIMGTLVNYGSSEYGDWSTQRQAWNLESAAIIEPAVNFIVPSFSKGKRRPRWALIDRAYMNNTWRSSQASYHLYRIGRNISPSVHVNLLLDDLLDLSLHNYETVRRLASKCLLNAIKRWPSVTGKYVIKLAENLKNRTLPEHAVLGSCVILSCKTILKRLTMDIQFLSSFLLGILYSSHNESLKAQNAITQLFVKFNTHFVGLPRKTSGVDHTYGSDFSNLIDEIGSMSFLSTNLHWRYNLMANRVLLVLAMASQGYPNIPVEILRGISGHFLKNLKSQLPQTRRLAVSALNTLLKESPYKHSAEKDMAAHEYLVGDKSSLEDTLTGIFQEEGFFNETLDSLSNVHIIKDVDVSSKGNYRASSMQNFVEKSITNFYFDFSSSWPRTPSWISLFGDDYFYSSFARIFKRLVQECGISAILSLRSSLEQFVVAKERTKQCVAAEALAGVLHSDVIGTLEEWDNWIEVQLNRIIIAPSVEPIPEWTASIRYAVTGKGKSGTIAPLLRQKVIDCLMKALPQLVPTSVVAKRYTFLAAVLIELSPPRMPEVEKMVHYNLLDELLNNMTHPSGSVREAIGVSLSVLCSNLRLYASFHNDQLHDGGMTDTESRNESWDQLLVRRASELVPIIQSVSASDSLGLSSTSGNIPQDEIKWMETLLFFIISSLKSGRSSALLDVIVKLLYPVIALQETSNKDLSNLAKSAFELLKWLVVGPHLTSSLYTILSLADDPNWRTRSATLTLLRSLVYRHTFILSDKDKISIWNTVEKLLGDNQHEVREHAAAVLAGLMKVVDEDFVTNFRQKTYDNATSIINRRKHRGKLPTTQVASLHGSILALAACVLSVPYDMPSWLPEHVTLLAGFVSEQSPLKSTVTKAIAEFRRTHADEWSVHKDSFTEEQLEVLNNTSASSSYFA